MRSRRSAGRLETLVADQCQSDRPQRRGPGGHDLRGRRAAAEDDEDQTDKPKKDKKPKKEKPPKDEQPAPDTGGAGQEDDRTWISKAAAPCRRDGE